MLYKKKNQQSLIKILSNEYTETEERINNACFLMYQGKIEEKLSLLPQVLPGLLFAWADHGLQLFDLKQLKASVQIFAEKIEYIGVQFDLYDRIDFDNKCLKEAAEEVFFLNSKEKRRAAIVQILHTEIIISKMRSVSCAIMEEIFRTNGKVKVYTLAEQLDYSVRHMHRLFRADTGLGPKEYERIVRARLTVERMLAHPNEEISYYMEGFAYSDQAHFQREFKWYMGITPRQFLLLLKMNKE